jgi:hypothetical protein
MGDNLFTHFGGVQFPHFSPHVYPHFLAVGYKNKDFPPLLIALEVVFLLYLFSSEKRKL